MTIETLYDNCLDEIAAFRAKQEQNTTHCFELMEAALRDDNSTAFTYVYRAYIRMVRHWVSLHSAFPHSGETADYFASVAFSNFYYHARGDGFDKFTSISGALGYLKACTHSAVAQYMRSRRLNPLPLDEVPPVARQQDFDMNIQQANIWERIQTLLDDPDDVLLVRLVFFNGMKNAEITEKYPDIWEDARSVTVALQRIKRRMRTDKTLRDLLRSMV